MATQEMHEQPEPSAIDAAALAGQNASASAAPQRLRVLPSTRAPQPIADDVESIQRQLAYYRDKAVQLDVLVFEMRALLQSGKGFSEILNIDPLLKAFMSVCRERYGAVNSAVLLLDDLDPATCSIACALSRACPITSSMWTASARS